MPDPLDLYGLKRVFARSHWPRLIRQGHEAGRRALDAFCEREEAMAA